MAKKEYYLIIDTETCNSVEQPIPYDIGYAICDRTGKIYIERSYVVSETFLGMKDTMVSAYYAEKIPKYWDDLKKGNRELKSVLAIRKQLIADMRAYKVRKVGAYNMGFDKRALNNLVRYHSKSFLRWFFPFGTEFFDIWHMATQTILSQKTFFKMAVKNDWVSQSGNVRTSAEIAYRYITKKLEFDEQHMGLEDVRIETEIFAYCLKQHKKLDWSVKANCWRIPQSEFKKVKW